MKKVVTNFVFAVCFIFTSTANANVILSLDPATQTTDTGDIVSVTVMIDGLGDFVPLSLAAFDLDVTFDSSALSFTGYNLFDGLGVVDFFDPFADAEDWSWGEYAPGVVNLAEISYLSNFDLWNLQPSSFALAELFFSVDAAVTSEVAFSYADLDDANGDAINIIEVNNALITGATPVPTPATTLLMALALMTLCVRKKYQS